MAGIIGPRAAAAEAAEERPLQRPLPQPLPPELAESIFREFLPRNPNAVLVCEGVSYLDLPTVAPLNQIWKEYRVHLFALYQNLLDDCNHAPDPERTPPPQFPIPADIPRKCVRMLLRMRSAEERRTAPSVATLDETPHLVRGIMHAQIAPCLASLIQGNASRTSPNAPNEVKILRTPDFQRLDSFEGLTLFLKQMQTFPLSIKALSGILNCCNFPENDLCELYSLVVLYLHRRLSGTVLPMECYDRLSNTLPLVFLIDRMSPESARLILDTHRLRKLPSALSSLPATEAQSLVEIILNSPDKKFSPSILLQLLVLACSYSHTPETLAEVAIKYHNRNRTENWYDPSELGKVRTLLNPPPAP